MKIFFCIPTLNKGGAERAITNLANYMSRSNNISIIAFNLDNVCYDINKNIKLISFFTNKNVKYISFNNSKIIKFIRKIMKFRKIVKKENPDLIVSFLPSMDFVAILGKRKKDKILISIRNSPKSAFNKRYEKIGIKLLYPKVNGVVYQTQEEADDLKNIIESISTIIPNPVSPLFFEDTYEGKRKKEIVSVGRLENQKNYELLINAFEIVHRKFPEYKLIIYGEGTLRKKLEELIDIKGLKKYVELPGIENNIKNKIYKSSLFVLSSDFEGMPNALMEAMALGLPTISTDCNGGGPRSLIVNNKNGILVKNNDVFELANAIIKVLSNKQLQYNLGKNASNMAKEWEPNIINEKWESFIYKIIKSSK